MSEVGMSPLVESARAFAHAAHTAACQVRKYTGEPYIAHPAAVAGTVAYVTNDQNAIAAAWLHDVQEDCLIPNGMIEHFFGAAVAKLVDECSHRDYASDPRKLNRAERMGIELSRAFDISPTAKTIKLADLLDNTASIVERDPKFAVVYMAEKRKLLSALIGGNQRLWDAARFKVENYYGSQGALVETHLVPPIHSGAPA